MKLDATKWLIDASTNFIGKTIEILFRIVLFLLPLGAYMLLMQFRTKASSVSNISVYTNPQSSWQHVYPGVIMISINPNYLQEKFALFRKKFNLWVITNKYLIEFTFALILVLLMVLIKWN